MSDEGTPVWTDGLSDDARAYVQTKGFENVGAVVDSYINLEKLHGVPADQMLKLPKEDDAEGWKGVYSKLGALENADDYQLPVPEGDSGDFAKQAAAWMAELSVPAPMAKGLAEKWNEYAAGIAQKQQEDYDAKLAAEETKLKQDWGAAAEQNEQIARKAAAAFGVDAETVNQLEKSMGYGKVMGLFHTIGLKMGEAEFVGGEGGTGSGGGRVLGPQEAQAKLSVLRSDKAYMEAAMKKGTPEFREYQQLNQWAYPGNLNQ